MIDEPTLSPSEEGYVFSAAASAAPAARRCPSPSGARSSSSARWQMRPYRAELELCAPMGDAPASMPGGVGSLNRYGRGRGRRSAASLPNGARRQLKVLMVRVHFLKVDLAPSGTSSSDASRLRSSARTYATIAQRSMTVTFAL